MPLAALLLLFASAEGQLTNLLTGGPVRKAEVLFRSKQETRRVVSDVNGRYKVEGLAAGQYRVSVQRPGFLPVLYGARGPNRPGKLLRLAPEEARRDVNFQLEPPAVIAGHVLDQDAEPLQGIAVQAVREEYAPGAVRYATAAMAATDDLGEYRLYGLPAGKYFLATRQAQAGVPELVYPAVFYPSAVELGSAAPVTVAPGSEARDIDLHVEKAAAVTVRGLIAGPAVAPGGPLPQLRVSLLDRAAIMAARPVANVMVQPGGRFEIPALAPGRYVFSARLQHPDGGVFWGVQQVNVGGVELGELRIGLLPGLELSGSVTFTGGAEAGRGRVMLTRLEESGSPAVAALAEDGSFHVKGLTPGLWRVRFAPLPPDSFIEGPDAIEVGTEPLPLWRITVNGKGGAVEGVVGNKVESATVLLLQEGGNEFQTAVSDSEGRYRVSGLRPGKYRAWAFEDIDAGMYEDPEFRKKLEGGELIEVAPGARVKKDLTP